MDDKMFWTFSFFITCWFILLILIAYNSHRQINHNLNRELVNQEGSFSEVEFAMNSYNRLKVLLPSKRRKAIFHLINELKSQLETFCQQWNYPFFMSIEQCSNSSYPNPCDLLEFLKMFEDTKTNFDEEKIIDDIQKVFDAKFFAKHAHIDLGVTIDHMINPGNRTFIWDVPLKDSSDSDCLFDDKVQILVDLFLYMLPKVPSFIKECSETALQSLNQNKSSETSIEILKAKLFLENIPTIKTDISRRISVLNIMFCLNNQWLNFFNAVSEIYPIVIVGNIFLGILFHQYSVVAFSFILILEGVCYRILAVTMDCYCKTQTIFWSFKVVKKMRRKSPSQRIYRLMNKKDRRRFLKRSKQSRKSKIGNNIPTELTNIPYSNI